MRKAMMVATLALACAVPAMAQNVVSNGTFDTDLSGWTNWAAPWGGSNTAWDAAGNPGGSALSQGGGSQGIYQVIPVAAGTEVTLNADWNVSNASWIEVMLFSFASEPTHTDVHNRADTGAVADIAFKREGYNSGGWVTASGSVWPGGNGGTIISQGYVAVATKLGNGGTANFDNITLTPEPATMALLGLPALAIFRRRRHA